MSSLALRLHKQSVQTSMGAVATLQQVANESGDAVTRGRRIDVTIPANAGSRAYSVGVEPGRWLVEATLPSGEVISKEVAVASGEHLPVTLQSVEHSPHEWLGLQYLVGNVEGAETLRRLSAKDVVVSTGLESTGRHARARTDQPTVRIWQSALRAAEAWRNILSPDTAPLASLAPAWQDSSEATWLYQVDAAHQRQFGLVEWLGERFAVSLPLPWQGVGTDERVPVQMMVRMEPRQNDIRIGVVVEDPDFAPMAGLMSASALPKAAIAVRQARHMLYEKVRNPLGAAAGGYVLLAAGDLEEASWHDWVDNLANWFPHIPDGAILKASLRLRFPRDKNSGEEARASLLDAFDRGVPFYSAGVSWLLDGLTQFADDPGVEEKMKIVHRIALRLDLSQAFTVVRISDRTQR
ncbi:hypothetical protein MesoLjLc_67510 [Mesorhizobium sp. L-8-10]|uniref:hypothetical protein n=1 Tax=Mesorhizobium sp. L-8-10 TaxID=2744523 RepID=UPI001927BACD|nr:hypothetical protein [Mesorhizobium sp. L-8-10]BCH34821.1 hypothetical protein MesoLjLc_67510 [Mesorhizobium sp. L-8-10]